MATERIITTFQLKRGTAERWRNINPVLQIGEPGVEYDTHKLKIGDGVTPWNNLPYISGQGGTVTIDNKSIKFSNGAIEIADFEFAQEGMIPIKNENGSISWIKNTATVEPIPIDKIKEILEE